MLFCVNFKFRSSKSKQIWFGTAFVVYLPVRHLHFDEKKNVCDFLKMCIQFDLVWFQL